MKQSVFFNLFFIQHNAVAVSVQAAHKPIIFLFIIGYSTE